MEKRPKGRYRDIALACYGCQPLRPEVETLAVIEACYDLGLTLADWSEGLGKPNPRVPRARVQDFIAANYRRQVPKSWIYPGDMVEGLGGVLYYPACSDPLVQPMNYEIERHYPSSWWVEIRSNLSGQFWPGLAREQMAAISGETLEQLGHLLYPIVQPTVAVIVTDGLDECDSYALSPRDEAVLDQRRLVVGWRSWYSPGYIERFGDDLLMGLPDHSERLPDGGIHHRINAGAGAASRYRWSAYESVRLYAQANALRLEYPRFPPGYDPRERRQR